MKEIKYSDRDEFLNELVDITSKSENVHIEQIGQNGMTNSNFLFNGEKLVRYPTRNYAPTLNRECEQIAVNLLKNELYVSLPYILLENGCSIRDYVTGDYFKEDDSKLYQIIDDAMETVHGVDVSDYKDSKSLDVYARFLHFNDINGDKHKNLKTYAEKCFKWIKNENWPLVFSHGDMMPSNVIVNVDNVTLIDFEYACLADEMYDIACFGNMDDKYGLKLFNEHYCNGRVMYDSIEPILKHYYMWRYIQVFNWLNVAEYKANNTTSIKLRDFFLKYAESCKEKLKYYKKVIEEKERAYEKIL